jgi:3-oxoacyl-[acyl-carrier protein] reductase
MDFGLSGRKAIVGGASSGLGLAIAETLRSEGADVAMVARGEGPLRREAERIGGHPIPADLGNAEDAERMVEEAMAAMGGLDILVWNSGGPRPALAVEVDEERLQATFDLVLLPLIRLVRLTLPFLRESEAGRIIGITSTGIKQPTPEMALSNAVRPGVHGYLKTLSNELAPDGITVNVLAPGRLLTPRTHDIFPDGIPPAQTEEIPMGRWGDAQEFADVAVFLASDRASYVTGTTLPIDGGLSRSAF